jgi:hypothetical protein
MARSVDEDASPGVSREISGEALVHSQLEHYNTHSKLLHMQPY